MRGDAMLMAVTVTTNPTLQFGEPRELFRVSEPLLQFGAQYYLPWDVGPDAVREASAPLIVVESWLEELRAKLAK